MLGSPPTGPMMYGARMKIAVVCPYSVDRPGGVQTVCFNLAANYLRAGHEAYVVAPGVDVRYRAPGLGHVAVRLLGRTTGIPINGSVAPVALRPSVWRDTLWLIADADVVHVHEPFIPMASLAVSRSAQVPVVATFHAAPAPQVAAWYDRVGSGLKRLARKVVTSTAVSDVAAAGVESFMGRVPVIANGVEVTALPDTDRFEHSVLFIGRDEPRKGLGILLSAWQLVVRSIPNATLSIVGAEASGAREVGPGVRFLGFVSEADKQDLLHSSQVLACPNTEAESFGLVPLEAMASGCALAISRLPAFESLVGDAGVFHDVGDVRGLASDIIKLLDSDQQARSFGERGRSRAGEYSWDRVAGDYLSLLTNAGGE